MTSPTSSFPPPSHRFSRPPEASKHSAGELLGLSLSDDCSQCHLNLRWHVTSERGGTYEAGGYELLSDVLSSMKDSWPGRAFRAANL